jgi:hypothetical protein
VYFSKPLLNTCPEMKSFAESQIRYISSKIHYEKCFTQETKKERKNAVVGLQMLSAL